MDAVGAKGRVAIVATIMAGKLLVPTVARSVIRKRMKGKPAGFPTPHIPSDRTIGRGSTPSHKESAKS